MISKYKIILIKIFFIISLVYNKCIKYFNLFKKIYIFFPIFLVIIILFYILFIYLFITAKLILTLNDFQEKIVKY